MEIRFGAMLMEDFVPPRLLERCVDKKGVASMNPSHPSQKVLGSWKRKKGGKVVTSGYVTTIQTKISCFVEIRLVGQAGLKPKKEVIDYAPSVRTEVLYFEPTNVLSL